MRKFIVGQKQFLSTVPEDDDSDNSTADKILKNLSDFSKEIAKIASKELDGCSTLQQLRSLLGFPANQTLKQLELFEDDDHKISGSFSVTSDASFCIEVIFYSTDIENMTWAKTLMYLKSENSLLAIKTIKSDIDVQAFVDLYLSGTKDVYIWIVHEWNSAIKYVIKDLCRNIQQFGFCKFKSNCHFNHPEPTPQAFNPIPLEITHNYQQLLQLDLPSSNQLGLTNVSYQANSNVFLKRIVNLPSVDQSRVNGIERWQQLKHPNIVSIREAFSTRSFNDLSLIIAYDFIPNVSSLSTIFISKRHFLKKSCGVLLFKLQLLCIIYMKKNSQLEIWILLEY